MQTRGDYLYNLFIDFYKVLFVGTKFFEEFTPQENLLLSFKQL